MRADDLWPHSRIAILKQMWTDGATAAAIAERLGVSRSAVLGKIHRLRHRTAEQKLAAVLERRRAARQLHQPGRVIHPRRRGISLLDLTNDTCRWPHGEPGKRGFFFCGAPDADLEGGRPYCARHMRRAYSKTAPAALADDSPIVASRDVPSIAPSRSSQRYVWRALVKHPAPRWR